jgi:hypothetical protein
MKSYLCFHFANFAEGEAVLVIFAIKTCDCFIFPFIIHIFAY